MNQKINKMQGKLRPHPSTPTNTTDKGVVVADPHSAEPMQDGFDGLDVIQEQMQDHTQEQMQDHTEEQMQDHIEQMQENTEEQMQEHTEEWMKKQGSHPAVPCCQITSDKIRISDKCTEIPSVEIACSRFLAGLPQSKPADDHGCWLEAKYQPKMMNTCSKKHSHYKRRSEPGTRKSVTAYWEKGLSWHTMSHSPVEAHYLVDAHHQFYFGEGGGFAKSSVAVKANTTAWKQEAEKKHMYNHWHSPGGSCCCTNQYHCCASEYSAYFSTCTTVNNRCTLHPSVGNIACPVLGPGPQYYCCCVYAWAIWAVPEIIWGHGQQHVFDLRVGGYFDELLHDKYATAHWG